METYQVKGTKSMVSRVATSGSGNGGLRRATALRSSPSWFTPLGGDKKESAYMAIGKLLHADPMVDTPGGRRK
eukprot:4399388-Amphidinium_carterae.1